MALRPRGACPQCGRVIALTRRFGAPGGAYHLMRHKVALFDKEPCAGSNKEVER